MEAYEAEALRASLETLILQKMRLLDPQVLVGSKLREDNKIDVRVVSSRFEGLDAQERERIFWDVFEETPKSELIHMTYALMMTPEEAIRFSESCMNRNPIPTDGWEE